MVGEGVEGKLYDAASRGDLPTFHQLLQENPYLLDEVSFAGSRNLLHIATIWGRLSIVEEILTIHNELTATPHMCWSRDCNGMNPIHIAAMKGDVNILAILIDSDPFSAREKVGRGDTVLHLCVKHNRLDALKFLAGKLGDLINEGDDDGDTVLHLAVRYKKVEIIKYLVESKKIDKKSRNGKGKTALGILNESPDPDTTSESSEIREILKCKKITYTLIKLDDVVMVVVILIAVRSKPPGGRVAGRLINTQSRGSCDGVPSSQDIQTLRTS